MRINFLYASSWILEVPFPGWAIHWIESAEHTGSSSEKTYVLEILKRSSPILDTQVQRSTVEEILKHILIRHLQTLEVDIPVSVLVAFRRGEVENVNVENRDRFTVGPGLEAELGEKNVEE